jgi:hypothetical protein
VIAIASATVCSCGAPVLLVEIDMGKGSRWQAHCKECLDPVEDCSSAARCVGHGDTPDLALWDWQTSHELALAAAWVPVTTVSELERQVKAEAERQRGWTLTGVDFSEPRASINYYGPAPALAVNGG